MKKTEHKNYIKTLFGPWKENKISFLTHIGAAIILLLIGLLNIELIRRLILSIEQNLGMQTVLMYSCLSIVLALIVFAGNLSLSSFRPKHLIANQKYFYKKYLNQYILLDNERVSTYGTGKFINILSAGVLAAAETLYIILFELGVSMIAYILNIIMVGYINIYLVIPVIIITLLLLLSMSYTSTKTFKYREERKNLWGEESRHIVKILMEKFTILKSGKGEEEVQKVLNISDSIAVQGKKVAFFIKLLEEGSQTIIQIGEVLLIGIIAYFIYQNTSSIADIGALLFIMALIKKNISSLSIYYRQINNYSNDVTRLLETFESIPSIKNYESGKEFCYKRGEIEIKNLGFAYPNGTKVFHNLNVKIAPQSKVAFIGRSGSGKSTLLKLLLNFLQKESGEILIDAQELGELSLKSYYKHIGYLQQEPAVFDGSVLENILYGVDLEDRVTQREIKEAISSAHCDFVYMLSEGLDTQIGEKGVRLSGGEKQRLAIARIFLQNPSIIILDEPTSALDSFSEESISESLKELAQGKTMITIAHRLQTIMNSDNIILFDNGKIIDSGSHEELLNKSAIYTELVDLQSGKVKG